MVRLKEYEISSHGENNRKSILKGLTLAEAQSTIRGFNIIPRITLRFIRATLSESILKNFHFGYLASDYWLFSRRRESRK
ncbi:hypothetical protein CbuD7D7780_00025 [Coxiella burnetii]|nr:hypothetical protein CbuD7E6568_00025 [Coxiella burnetii]OYK83170.1 hypothetical protein CbuD7D7780_00025 [Coxiella burnetii]